MSLSLNFLGPHLLQIAFHLIQQSLFRAQLFLQKLNLIKALTCLAFCTLAQTLQFIKTIGLICHTIHVLFCILHQSLVFFIELSFDLDFFSKIILDLLELG